MLDLKSVMVGAVLTAAITIPATAFFEPMLESRFWPAPELKLEAEYVSSIPHSRDTVTHCRVGAQPEMGSGTNPVRARVTSGRAAVSGFALILSSLPKCIVTHREVQLADPQGSLDGENDWDRLYVGYIGKLETVDVYLIGISRSDVKAVESDLGTSAAILVEQ